MYSLITEQDATLTKLHYEVTSNTGLLQSEVTNYYGYRYRCIVELYKKLKFSIYEPIIEAYKNALFWRTTLLRTKENELAKVTKSWLESCKGTRAGGTKSLDKETENSTFSQKATRE